MVSEPAKALAQYLTNAPSRALPAEVAERAKMHILDTIASIVAGSQAPAGQAAGRWLEAASGGAHSGPATVLGQRRSAPPRDAALCNGLSAHAEETDDSHGPSLSHPGCATVPAALAVAERIHAPGSAMVRAVVAGYDLGGRVGRALRAPSRRSKVSRWSSHGVAGTFCAAGACGVLLNFDETSHRYLFSYASHLASGNSTYLRDPHHVQKAFVFAGMPAHHGVLAASLVEGGLDGVDDVFGGAPNWLEALEADVEPDWLSWKLGTEFEVMHTSIKKYAVGSPAQAAVEAAATIARENRIALENIGSIEIRLPSDRARVVDSRAMLNINVQYAVVATLENGAFSAALARDLGRAAEPRIADLVARSTLIPDQSMAGTGSARVTVRLAGRVLTSTVATVHGTPSSPMTWDEVTAKAEDLISDSLGAATARNIIEAVTRLEDMPDVRTLGRLCAG